jgi:peptidyl-prolyl cis-trans isomerase C
MRIFLSAAIFCLGGALSAQVPAPKPKTAPPVKPPVAARPKPAQPKPAEPAKPPAAEGFDKVVLTVGTEKITAGDFDKLIESLPEQYRAAAKGPGKRQVAEQLITMKSLAQEARKRKLDQDASYQTQLAFQAENLLAGALYRDLSAKLKVEDADVRKYYDGHKNEYERVKARHILVRFKGSAVPTAKADLTEEEALTKAKALRARLSAGEDFATLAKAESDDTGSGNMGGDLNFFGHGQMAPQFEQAAFAAPVGQVTEPVKTQFGYHLILVEKHEVKTFDEVRPEIENKIRPEIAKKAVDDLRKNTTVNIDEAFFGPPPAK